MTKTRRKHKTRKNKTIRRLSSNIKINSNFECGNIKVISIKQNHDKHLVHLEIKNDPKPKNMKRRYKNWFYFKATNVKNKDITFIIKNIKNYDNDWKGFNVAVSYDNKNWTRHNTKLKGRKLIWSINPKKSTIWFAYYPPYPFSKIKSLLSNMQIIGRTPEKRSIYMKKLGWGDKKVWLISGQHPGETINSWILHGFLNRLKERKHKLYKKYTFYIVPNANPDGNVKGYWYLNSKGYNLNRDWITAQSQEVQIIKRELVSEGYDLVFDIHGDEGSPKHFLVSSWKNPHKLHNKINRALNKQNKHFRPTNYYTDKYMKGAKETLDDLTVGITIEGAMKHPLYYHKTLQEEPLYIGKCLADTLETL